MRFWSFFYYLTHLEWKEKVQTYCVFCDQGNFKDNIVYEDDELIAINNKNKAGTYHWLIMPKSHQWRDVENLSYSDAPLVQSMVTVKEKLLEDNCPTVPPNDIHTGFHRGRRVLAGNLYWPDIISIHHLHMHVIVEPQFWLRLFKYPAWLSLMWKSEEQVERDLDKKPRRRVIRRGAFGIME